MTYSAQDWARDFEHAIDAAGLNVGAPLGRATSRAVGRVIRISSRTVDRWRSGENCPGVLGREMYLERLRAISANRDAAPMAGLRSTPLSAAPRFATPEERVAFAAGVLTMVNVHLDQLKSSINDALTILLTPADAGSGTDRGPEEP